MVHLSHRSTLRRHGALALALALIAAAGTARAGDQPSTYAIVISQETRADADWAAVAEALEAKHQGRIIAFEETLEETLPTLRDLFPRYICFVATPEEATRAFVAACHHLTRRLDDDPYGDAIWAILTGYDAADALRIARHSEPLEVRRAFSATVGAPLDEYDEGLLFDELKPNRRWVKKPGGEAKLKECPTDTTALLVEAWSDYAPDVVITSGHATESDWNPGYGYRNGRFLCKDGQLYGVDLEGARHDVRSANPKIHLGIGNCLLGHIEDRQSIALALIHSAGSYQVLGYTIATGYGFGGWGVKDYFSELQAGRFTLAEAQFANHQALLYHLIAQGRVDQPWNRASSFDLLGDRDTVVLYGDPAWEARMPERELPWSQDLLIECGRFTFTIRANRRGDWDNRPIFHFLPVRVSNVQIVEGEQYEPVITNTFILVPMYKDVTPMHGNRGERFPIRGDFEEGQEFRIVFEATWEK